MPLVDELELPPPVPPAGPVCPWCSAELTSPDQAACAACGANLVTEDDVELPGVTSFDEDTRLRLGRAEKVADPPTRKGFFAWMSADEQPNVGPALDAETAAILQSASIEPASAEVRREMLRLEMEALQHELEAGASTPEDGIQRVDDGVIDDVDAAEEVDLPD